MDTTEPAPAPDPVRRPSKSEGGSQSKLPPILLWIVAAAVLLRIVTAVLDREKKDEGAGLVRWQAHQNVAAAARSAGKRVLYDFTAAWCPPCHRLDSEGWTDSEIASVVNSSYLPARIVDREREDGKNPPSIEALQRLYSVTAFPTLVVAEPDGRQVAKLQGYPGRERLVRFLQESKAAARP